MFNKLKQFKDLRSQAKTMQNVLASEAITVSKGGITAVVNGNMKLVSLTINEDLAKDSLEGMIVECVNEALKKAQYVMAEKVKSMGGFPGLNMS